ncbi:hypothetical protein RND81_12G136600 [Saponaria officinalis]|uniref:CCT domain-containing protein n=1 Tax=Saponaria officinalis TaxID=3572 RepID=A0AAW1HA69_SAPOF
MCSIASTHILRDTQGEEDEDNRHQEHDRSLAMSLQDVVDPPRPPPSPPPSQQPSDNISGHLIDDISIPISAEIFDFDDSDIFHDTLQSSEVTSSPNCYFQGDQNDQNGSTTSSTTTTATTIAAPNHQHPHHQNGNLSLIYDPQVDIDNDISASIDFSTPPVPLTYNNLNHATLVDQIALTTSLSQYPTPVVDPSIAMSLLGGPPLGLGTVYEDDCLSSVPHFLRTAVSTSSSSCTFLDPNSIGSFHSGSVNTTSLCGDGSTMFGGSLLMSSELQAKELDFQGENGGIFCADQLGRFNSGDLQAFSNENSQMKNGATNSTPISTEISSLDDPTYKVGKLSAEQRKEKIHRYMKKRNERNFSKKIKYACRKTLADSRPRVRGRFAKNDEYGDGHKLMNGHHEDDDYDDVAVKEEEDMVDSSDIFAHISGVNSFKCNYQIQSWI